MLRQIQNILHKNQAYVDTYDRLKAQGDLVLQKSFIAIVLFATPLAQANSNADCYLSPQGCVIGNPDYRPPTESSVDQANTQIINDLGNVIAMSMASIETPVTTQGTVSPNKTTKMSDRTRSTRQAEEDALRYDDIEIGR